MEPRLFAAISQNSRCGKLAVVHIQGILMEMDLPPISKCIFTFKFNQSC